MKLLSTRNYLHFGDSIDQLLKTDHLLTSDHLSKDKLIQYLKTSGLYNKYVHDVVWQYLSPLKRTIAINELKEDVIQSIKHRSYFDRFKCRGFSYKFITKLPRMYVPLKKKINLRFGLFTAENLYYPPIIRSRLRVIKIGHYQINKYPAICFALGIAQESKWFILALQSDLVFHKKSIFREHFKGWRKVLFDNIVRSAPLNVNKIYLIAAKDVIRTCHQDYRAPEAVPRLWNKIYDLTAADFGMKLVSFKRPVNVQLYPRQKDVNCEEFWALNKINYLESGK